ncbi:hypothetical protein HanHA300_Chr09g0307691 [Helianthus annuus]|nr:hypothetical protein HanHA300_Chr09g0307691 [Helianthus annuus]KAJ0892027.1 hypothetical protein HanPSC8_Chr09g0361011 [Helianthus annuus]
MAKTKKPAGKTNQGNVVASSSATPSQQRGGKRKLVSQELENEVPQSTQSRREPMEEEDETNPYHVHIWKSGSLNDFKKDLQVQFFNEKIKGIGDRKEAFICEREITDHEFRPFGIIQRFEALGWEAALKCYDGEKTSMYMDPIQEWMASLEVTWGKSLKNMSLKGYANGKTVIMSGATLKQIAKFDSRPSAGYTYLNADLLFKRPDRHPEWPNMLVELFEPGKGGQMVRDDLKLPVRLMLLFVVQNVMPRRGDKKGIRKWEIPILYSLMTGRLKVSFTHLVMMNIWEARNSKGKKIIPHCRLITALLKKNGVFDMYNKATERDISPFTLKNLSKFKWELSTTERYLKLEQKDTGKKLRALKPDARVLEPGESDEAFSDDNAMGMNDELDEEGENEIDMEAEAGIGMISWVHTEPRGAYITSRGIGDEMAKVIQQARTPDWSDFPGFAQVIYDQNTHHRELNRLESQRIQEMLTSLLDRSGRPTSDTL